MTTQQPAEVTQSPCEYCGRTGHTKEVLLRNGVERLYCGGSGDLCYHTILGHFYDDDASSVDVDESEEPEYAPPKSQTYRIPIVELASVEQFRPTRRTIMYRLRWDGGILEFSARIGSTKQMFVDFHGAVDQSKHIGLMFARFREHVASQHSFLLFSDPTLKLDSELRLGWYVGSQWHDPEPVMQAIVGKMSERSAADTMTFIGASAGGFTALMHSQYWPGSHCVVLYPHTSPRLYSAKAWTAVLEAGFSGVHRDNIEDVFADRFDPARRYANGWANHVLMVRNTSAKDGVNNHIDQLVSRIPEDAGSLTVIDADLGSGSPSLAQFARFFEVPAPA